MLRTDHQTQTALTLHVSLSQNRPIALYVSSLQDDHLSIKRYGMKRSTSCTFAVLLHPTTTHLANIFFELLSQPFPTETSKYANLQNHHVLDLTSHPVLDPCPIKVDHEPKWQPFDVLWRATENQRFNQIEKFLWQITPLNKLFILAKKKFAG